MDLTPLLAPRSVAVVGATDRTDSYAGNVLRNLNRAGYPGEVWGVNPKREQVLGRPCVPSVAELPGPVDALVVAIPAGDVAEVVRAGAERGCGGAVVLSAGFGEVEPGRVHETALREVAGEHDLAVCGPNGNGIVAVEARAMLWGDRLPELEPGPVAMVTQSGNAGVNALGSRRGIRWHTVISTGNQAVCRASDWLHALAERDGTRSVALFLESDDDGPALAEALARCVEQGVGVAVLKVGSSAAGAQAAQAHTGALAGDQRVFRALVEEAGAAWAEDFHDLLELARALAEPRARARGDGGLAVLTCSGGDSGVAADQAAELGVELPPLSAPTAQRLAELLPAAATIANPLDYTAMIWGDSELLRKIVTILAADDVIDQLLVLYDQPADADESWTDVREGLIAGGIEAEAAAVMVASTLPDLLDERAALEFATVGIPAVAGLRSALRCALALRAPPGDPARLREIAAAARRVGADRREADGWLGEAETKALLRDAGVAVPAGGVVAGPDQGAALAASIGYPVALKLSGPHLQHKSDVGAIELGIRDEGELRAAFARLATLPEAAGASFLAEATIAPGPELLVAARADTLVPALVVGLGGIWAEAMDDVAVVPLPASPGRVEAALRSLRGAAVLTAARGGDAVDLRAVAALAARTGGVLLERRLSLLELNPVVANGTGAVALDALARG